MAGHALQLFHPLVRRWFAERFPAPTDAQESAWPAIARGENVLVSAPTGSGKTLTAFLWAIDSLVSGRWSTGGVRALYLSPLKALNSDVRLNLLTPLTELRGLFEREGLAFPPIRVMTRSGDTPDDERRAMLRHPPELLITTPESLNLMLTGSQSRQIFGGLETVILDEIHALAATKRGTYMMTAVERLVPGAGEFQRIALSATVRPPERIAAWMAGFTRTSSAPEAHYRPRPVTVVVSADRRAIALDVRSPDLDVVKGPDAADLRWQALTDALKAIVARNRSTLIFANSRRSVEKIARLLNADQAEPLAYSHHGSLSREIRLDVEERMKQGRLRAIVATGSLELGIDIGSVDEVVLIGTPPSVAQSLQRIGRADHRVGGTSRATLFPLHGLDGAEAASMVDLVARTAIEAIRPIANPLDVLAQVLLSMGCGVLWDVDQLFAFVRTVAAYHDLPRRHFDLVVAMLAGRYADSPVRELKTRALVDPVKNTFTTRAGTEFVLYQSGGTIPDRGYYHLRVADSKAVIGELDEEFVWERRLGDQFSLGTQTWRIHAITHNDVEVGPADPNAPMIPFWKAEDQNRSTETSFALLDFLDHCDKHLDESDFSAQLARTRAMDARTADNLVRFLRTQREVARAPLPGRHRLLVECSKDASAPSQDQQVVLHTFWGGRVNRPLAIAFAEAWERTQGTTLETFATNDQILFVLPDAFDPAGLFGLLRAAPLDELLRAGLEKTPLFGARFRENASRALLLPRGDARKRYPLWLNRLRSKKLLASVLGFQDFPIVLETWRDLLEDEFDLTTLAAVRDDIAAKRTALHVTRPAHPTPFSDGVVFRQTNYHMYLDDTPGGNPRSNLAEELFHDLFRGAMDQPTVPQALVSAFSEKLLRTHPDYRPATRQEVLLAVRELLLPPRQVVDGWIQQLPRGEGDASEGKERSATDPLAGLVAYRLPGARDELVSDLGDLPRILSLRGTTCEELPSLGAVVDADGGHVLAHLAYLQEHRAISDDDSGAGLVADHLRARVMVSAADIAAALGYSAAQLRPLLDELLESETIVSGQLVEGSAQDLFCDAENAERLLRLHRASRRAQAERSLPVRPIADLQSFLAEWHGLGRQLGGLEPLQQSLDRLLGFPAPAELWEEALLPSRLAPYYPSWLDTLFQSYGLAWLGAGKQRLTLAFPSDCALFSDDRTVDGEPAASVIAKLSESEHGLGFFDLAHATGIDTATLAETLWTLAWQGRVATDSFETVRRGILNDFSAERIAEQSGRSGFRRWEKSRPSVGAWSVVRRENASTGSIESTEIEKERARIVLGRYGVVFREMLEHELAPLRWSRLFHALRLLELSGEIVAGHFFEGVPGLQFATHEAVRRLAEPWPTDRLVFINACDPASLAGLGLPGLSSSLPRRLPGHWVVFRGNQLVLVLQKAGRDLTAVPPPGDPLLAGALAIYGFLLGRQFAPPTSATVETVNGESVLASPYADDLRGAGFVNDYRGMTLWKR
jgi:ATP-dependent helicase Lhr and Lhr-like helicase